MTNKEAIKWLEYEKNRWESDCKSIHPTKEALKMAINALEQEPCEDCISRQAVLEGINRYIKKAQSTGTKDDFISFEELVVKALPPVTQEPILNKIAAEIEQTAKDYDKFSDYRRIDGLWIALEIIDKYRKEQT